MNKELAKIYYAFLFLFLVTLFGTIGFMLVDSKYTLLDAFYMTIITMASVGYREIHHPSPVAMLFTITLIVISFGVFAYVLTTITQFVLDGEFRRHYRHYKLTKKINKMNNHVIVCGYGRNGRQAVLELIGHGEKVVIVEKNQTVSVDLSELPSVAHVRGDATDDMTMVKARIERAKALITTFPSDADNLMVVLTAKSMNPPITIISRASDEHSIVKLKRAGANNVIMPDKVGGTRMAKLVAQPDIVEFLDSILLKSGNDVILEEIACSTDMDNCFIDKTIGELNIRKVSGANLIGLKTEDGLYIFNPAPDIKLRRDYKLFALGTPKQLNELKKVLSEKN